MRLHEGSSGKLRPSPPTPVPIRLRRVGLRGFAAGLIVGSVIACGPPFKVPKLNRVSSAVQTARASTHNLMLEAGAILDEDTYFQDFDANLFLAGLLAVEVRIRNDADEPANLRRSTWRLSASSSIVFDHVSPKSALDRLYRYYGVRTYSKRGRKAFEERFQAVGLDTAAHLPPGEERHGLLFFVFPSTIDPLTTIPPLRLEVTRIGFTRTSEREVGIDLRLPSSQQ